MNVCYYFKIFGLAKDSDGNPKYAGVKLDCGKAKTGITYEQIVTHLTDRPDWKIQLITMLHLGLIGITEDQIEIITPEEFERDYGEDDIEEEDA